MVACLFRVHGEQARYGAEIGGDALWVKGVPDYLVKDAPEQAPKPGYCLDPVVTSLDLRGEAAPGDLTEPEHRPLTVLGVPDEYQATPVRRDFYAVSSL